MAAPLKNVYDQQFLEQFTQAVYEVVPNFHAQDYIKSVFDESWPGRELKQRMRHLSVTLHSYLTNDYERNASLLASIVRQLRKNGIKENSFEYMFLPDYIEVYGPGHYEASVKAMEYITQFTSCEFAVRPFILQYPEAMIKQLNQWANHEHPMVRRLASEGSRPRLPWAIAIPAFKEDPSALLPILDMLKDDESETVRRSVANNLNDIAKDNPDVTIQLAKRWYGKGQNTNWVVKHGCRTLLKQGNPEANTLRYQPDSIELTKIYFEYYTTNVATLEFGNHRRRVVVNYRLNEDKATLDMEIKGSIIQLHYQIKNDQSFKFDGTIDQREIGFDLIKIRDATK